MRIIIFLVSLLVAAGGVAQPIRSVTMDELVRVIDSSEGPVVVNFWATWCKPCVEEIPYFEKHTKEQNVGLLLVSLDFREDYPDKLRQFVASQQYRSTLLWLSETDADGFCPKIDKSWEGALPATLFVNNKNSYRSFVGTAMKEKRFELELQKMLGQAGGVEENQ